MHKTVYSLRGFRIKTVQYFMALYTIYQPCDGMDLLEKPLPRLNLIQSDFASLAVSGGGYL
jgi:hypothetical protein